MTVDVMELAKQADDTTPATRLLADVVVKLTEQFAKQINVWDAERQALEAERDAIKSEVERWRSCAKSLGRVNQPEDLCTVAAGITQAHEDHRDACNEWDKLDDEHQDLKAKLEAMTKARDEACDIAGRLARVWDHDRIPERIAELREVGK